MEAGRLPVNHAKFLHRKPAIPATRNSLGGGRGRDDSERMPGDILQRSQTLAMVWQILCPFPSDQYRAGVFGPVVPFQGRSPCDRILILGIIRSFVFILIPYSGLLYQ